MSDNKVILNYDGKSFEYPIVESTIGDRGIDISKLRDQTGLITLDLGYKNTGATLSDITYLDGDNGELYYRGYPIEQIAEKSNFTEVMYLLLHGELPTADQFQGFEGGIKNYNFVADEMKRLIDVFPRSAHPMGSSECTIERRNGSCSRNVDRKILTSLCLDLQKKTRTFYQPR
jgi:citrate synthase